MLACTVARCGDNHVTTHYAPDMITHTCITTMCLRCRGGSAPCTVLSCGVAVNLSTGHFFTNAYLDREAAVVLHQKRAPDDRRHHLIDARLLVVCEAIHRHELHGTDEACRKILSLINGPRQTSVYLRQNPIYATAPLSISDSVTTNKTAEMDSTI